MEILLIFLGGAAAGAFGALVGLGGGVIMVPLLNLVFHVPIKIAVAPSLCAVCATSIGGAARYLNRDLVEIRLGLFLETTTIMGAVAGGLLAIAIKPEIVSVTFAVVLLYTSIMMTLRFKKDYVITGPERAEEISFSRKYIALALSTLAGMVSAFLGVGGGVVQVPILHMILNLPLKVATATSTFMIGITAATGSVIYYFKDIIDYRAAAPLIIGTLVGSQLGARLAGRVDSKLIKAVFIIALIYAAVRIGFKGLGLELF